MKQTRKEITEKIPDSNKIPVWLWILSGSGIVLIAVVCIHNLLS